jgi:hypothetical protein
MDSEDLKPQTYLSVLQQMESAQNLEPNTAPKFLLPSPDYLIKTLLHFTPTIHQSYLHFLDMVNAKD